MMRCRSWRRRAVAGRAVAAAVFTRSRSRRHRFRCHSTQVTNFARAFRAEAAPMGMHLPLAGAVRRARRRRPPTRWENPWTRARSDGFRFHLLLLLRHRDAANSVRSAEVTMVAMPFWRCYYCCCCIAAVAQRARRLWGMWTSFLRCFLGFCRQSFSYDSTRVPEWQNQP